MASKLERSAGGSLLDFLHYARVAERSGFSDSTLAAISSHLMHDRSARSFLSEPTNSRQKGLTRLQCSRPVADEHFVFLLSHAQDACDRDGPIDWGLISDTTISTDQARSKKTASVEVSQLVLIDFLSRFAKPHHIKDGVRTGARDASTSVPYINEDYDSLDDGEDDSAPAISFVEKNPCCNSIRGTNQRDTFLQRAERRGRSTRVKQFSSAAPSQQLRGVQHESQPVTLRSSQRIRQMQMKQTSMSSGTTAPPLTYLRLTEEFVRNSSADLLASLMSANYFEVELLDGRRVDLVTTLDNESPVCAKDSLIESIDDPTGALLSFMEEFARNHVSRT